VSAPTASEPRFDRLVRRYVERTAKSRALNEAQRRVLAHSRATNRFNPDWKELVYPIVCDRADGARVWDVDGNEYVDLTMGLGVTLFGHKPPFVDEALRRQLERGNHLAAETPLAGEVAELVAEATGFERVAIVNTGSEAVLTAVRLARAVTGRPLIAMFQGSYHGWYDGLLGLRDPDGEVVPPAPGIPHGSVADLAILDYDDPAALAALREAGERLAAILVEPVQSSRIDVQPRAFLAELRRGADETGAALIFDEMITGFRLAHGGAQEWFGVRADLATYGKILGGGLPIGLVAGHGRFLDAVDGGAWTYGDDSAPTATRTAFAGTFSRNPLAMAAAQAVLRHLEAEGPELYDELNRRAADLAEQLRGAVERAGAPYRAAVCGSLLSLKGEDAAASELLSYHLVDRGIFAWAGGAWFLSTAHGDAECEEVVAAVEDALVEICAEL
jgi:glutamate-1-semialdehyde aminotransferase